MIGQWTLPTHHLWVENEGQIKLFKFGKKIFDKITEAMNPEFADETPVNPFDMWEGANFKLKIRTVEDSYCLNFLKINKLNLNLNF